MAAPRPVIKNTTTFRATAEDDQNASAIATAMRRAGLSPFATRSSAIRFALASVRNYLDQAGQLPIYTAAGGGASKATAA